MTITRPRAVAIVSGGLDSTVLAYDAAASGFDLLLLSVNYGQRHVRELECAARTARALEARHVVADLSSVFAQMQSASSLVSTTPVPDGHYAEDSMAATVVPNRNMILLAVATGHAVAWGAEMVLTGVHAGDHYIYPDCRPDFVHAISDAAHAATVGFAPDGFLGIVAPFVQITKADIVRHGDRIGVPFADTWSCYKGGDVHCGRCGTCVERAEAFAIAGVTDPTVYADPDYWQQAVREREQQEVQA